MKRYNTIILLLINLIISFPCIGNELTSYSQIKKALIEQGHEITFSVEYKDFSESTFSGLSGRVDGVKFFLPGSKNASKNGEYLSFTKRNITYLGKTKVEECRGFKIYKNFLRVDGHNFNVLAQSRVEILSESNAGKIIEDIKYYLTLGKTIHFYDNTFMSAGGQYKPSDFELFITWFEGEFDNFKQHLEDINNKNGEPHPRLHSIFKAADLPNFDGNTFYVQQYYEGDPDKIYRQRIYEMIWEPEEQSIVTKVYRFRENEKQYRDAHLKPELLKDIHPDDMKYLSGCDVFWKRNGNKFFGSGKEGTCSFISSKSGKKLTISDNLVLTEDAIWILENTVDENGNVVYGRSDNIHNKLRRCRFYEGWVAVKGEESEDYKVFRDLKFHDQGKKVTLTDEKTGEVLYTLQLSQLTYEKTDIDVMKLGVYKGKSDKTTFYIWGNPDAKRIGINLGWFQAGLTYISKEK